MGTGGVSDNCQIPLFLIEVSMKKHNRNIDAAISGIILGIGIYLLANGDMLLGILNILNGIIGYNVFCAIPQRKEEKDNTIKEIINRIESIDDARLKELYNIYINKKEAVEQLKKTNSVTEEAVMELNSAEMKLYKYYRLMNKHGNKN